MVNNSLFEIRVQYSPVAASKRAQDVYAVGRCTFPESTTIMEGGETEFRSASEGR